MKNYNIWQACGNPEIHLRNRKCTNFVTCHQVQSSKNNAIIIFQYISLQSVTITKNNELHIDIEAYLLLIKYLQTKKQSKKKKWAQIKINAKIHKRSGRSRKLSNIL